MILIPATPDDMELVLAWRNNPDIYKGFYTQKKPIEWLEHFTWWFNRNKDWREFIIIEKCRKIGVVSIGQLDHWSPEIGYFIGETSLWGKGYGKQAVELTLDWLRKYGKEYCHTTVLKDNARSLQLLKSLGFEILGEAREGEVWITKRL